MPLSTFNGINLAQVYGLFEVTATNGDDVPGRRRPLGEGHERGAEREEGDVLLRRRPAARARTSWCGRLTATGATWRRHTTTAGSRAARTACSPTPASGASRMPRRAATSLCSTAAAQNGALGLREQTGSRRNGVLGQHVAGIRGLRGRYLRRPGVCPPADRHDVGRRFDGVCPHAVPRRVARGASRTSCRRRRSRRRGRAWTLCSIPQTTAPFATRFVRLELVVQKTSGSAGVSVADFDDVWLGQYNSFYGKFAEDPDRRRKGRRASARTACPGPAGASSTRTR